MAFGEVADAGRTGTRGTQRAVERSIAAVTGQQGVERLADDRRL